MNITFKINLNNLQKEILNSYNNKDIEFTVVNCSRQIGKSIGCEVIMITSLFTMGNIFNAWISPTFRQCKKVYKDILKAIPRHMVAIANSSELIITLTNGNTLQFFSGESIDTMRGFTIRGLLIVDECAFINAKENWFEEVVLATTKNSRNKKIFLISTPCGKQGTFYEYYLKAKLNENGKYNLIEKTIYDDNFVSSEEILEIKKRTPKLIFEQEYEAKFLDNALTVFQGFEKCFSDYVFDDKLPIWCGIDLSTVGSDNTVITLINSVNQTKQYIINDMSLDKKYQHIANILNNIKNLKGVYIETNSIGEPIFNEIKKLLKNKQVLLPFTTTNESKQDIIDNLIVKIANNEISFDNENKILYSEFGTFTFSISKSKNIIYAAKNGYHDDTIMSLAIALKNKEDKVNINNFPSILRNPLNKIR